KRAARWTAGEGGGGPSSGVCVGWLVGPIPVMHLGSQARSRPLLPAPLRRVAAPSPVVRPGGSVSLPVPGGPPPSASNGGTFTPGRPAPDRNLALELVRVTEAAAMAAGRWVGRGDKNGGDGAAVDAMRALIGTVSMTGVVVIGEGEK